MTTTPKNVRWWALPTGTAALAWLLSAATPSAAQKSTDAKSAPAPTLDEMRLTMDKWIETQQILAKERNDWLQGKEILLGRLELVRSEVAALEGKVAEASGSVAATEQKRDELRGQISELAAVGTQLTAVVAGMEGEVRRVCEAVPDPVVGRIQPLRERIPENPAHARASTAERFQNVLGILNELNKANNEITVNYEVHTLADGRPAEVKALYVGLAQAYYVGSSGEGGVGRPSADGWHWEPSQAVAGNVLQALEIIQGKHSPAFVPLPIQIQ